MYQIHSNVFSFNSVHGIVPPFLILCILACALILGYHHTILMSNDFVPYIHICDIYINKVIYFVDSVHGKVYHSRVLWLIFKRYLQTGLKIIAVKQE